MKPLLLSALFPICLGMAPLVPHDFYVSILTIHHDPDKRALELTWRMTTHDLEDALEAISGEDPQLGSAFEAPDADTLIARYLRQHLRLSKGEAPLRVTYLGKEVELETLFCYLQVDSIRSTEGLTVQCDLLQERFPDQVNEVHVETQEGTESNNFLTGSQPFTFGMPKDK